MPKNIVKYDLLISCPGDIQNEIDLIKECVEEFNEKFSDTLGVMVQTRHWKSSAYAQSGGKPQELLNEQFVKDCDAAVAVFWTRFGTPTDKYGSGTEEEIEIMLEAKKQVFMYFCEKAISPSSLNFEQYEKIKKFKEKYLDRGTYFQYSTDEEFRKLCFSHLTKYFLGRKQMEENNNQKVPNLIVRGISNENAIEEVACIQKFKIEDSLSISYNIEKIRNQYKKISEIKIENTSFEIGNQLFTTTTKKVEIDENDKQIISGFAEKLSIEMGEDFFYLGGLSENTVGRRLAFGRRDFVGEKNEEEKYDLINSLLQMILELISWAPIEETFGEIDCLYLALENNGTAIDEDVEVTLYFNKNDILTVAERPIMEDQDVKYLIKKCNLYEIMKINSCADYLAYEDSAKKVSYVKPINQSTDYFGIDQTDYQEEYAENFEDALVYEIFEKDDLRVVKLQIDYIKHNSIVAFPAPIMLKGHPVEVRYQIRSKNISEVVSRSIKVIASINDNKELNCES